MWTLKMAALPAKSGGGTCSSLQATNTPCCGTHTQHRDRESSRHQHASSAGPAHLPVKPPGTQQSSVQAVGAVGGGNDNHAASRLQPAARAWASIVVSSTEGAKCNTVSQRATVMATPEWRTLVLSGAASPAGRPSPAAAGSACARRPPRRGHRCHPAWTPGHLSHQRISRKDWMLAPCKPGEATCSAVDATTLRLNKDRRQSSALAGVV